MRAYVPEELLTDEMLERIAAARKVTGGEWAETIERMKRALYEPIGEPPHGITARNWVRIKNKAQRAPKALKGR